MRFDAVFFDSGGTLFQDRPPADDPARTREAVGLGSAMRAHHALEGLGLACDLVRWEHAVARSMEEFKRRHGGRLTYHFGHVMEAALREAGLPARPEEAACLADAFAGPRYAAWLFPGTLETLRALHEAGVHVGLIANTAWPGWCMDRAFFGVGLLPFLRTRVYSGDEGVAKPDPAIFRIAEARSGLAGKRLLYAGDSLSNDIEGARAAGWAAALKRSSAPTSHGRADFEFDATPELLEFVLGR